MRWLKGAIIEAEMDIGSRREREEWRISGWKMWKELKDTSWKE